MSLTCDTSLVIPALLGWHPDHAACRAALARVTAIPAHVLLESYSVLTRLPAPHRIAPRDAGGVLEALEVPTVALPAKQHRRLVLELSRESIRGGATYDALVAATARHHDLELLTRDRRARTSYDAIGVSFRQV